VACRLAIFSRRLQQQEEPTMSTQLIVPTAVVKHLRVGLFSDLGDVANEIDGFCVMAGRETHPEWFEEPIRRFDSVRALLDRIGWGEPASAQRVAVDLDLHRPALEGALAGLLELERDLLDVDPSYSGAARQRKRAGRAVSEIERFLAANGMRIPEAD
jgi:hypothetical protein